MAKLVKIKDVYVYTGNTAEKVECTKALFLLKQKGIEYNNLEYNDSTEQHEANFKALSTWNFGEAENHYQLKFSKYPIVTWVECYDDWSTVQHAVEGLKALKESSLLNDQEAAE